MEGLCVLPLSDAPVIRLCNNKDKALVLLEGASNVTLLIPSSTFIIEKTSFRDGTKIPFQEFGPAPDHIQHWTC